MKRMTLAFGVLAVLAASSGCHLGTWGWPSRASMPVRFWPTKIGSGEATVERISRDGRVDNSHSRAAYGIRDGEPWDLR